MSIDTTLFQPPPHYPEAPKDMWYQVPEKVPEPPKPKQIFPWEAHAPKATRVFAQPRAPSPPPEPTVIPPPDQDQQTAVDTTVSTSGVSSPPTPIASPDPWAAFQQRTNAWDDMPEIEKYVQAMNLPRKGKLQVLHPTPANGAGSTDQKSPQTDNRRRTSLKLTDFPTEIERPSLPVTPAPIRRPTFWGPERDESHNLPAAEGVPKQEEWVRRFSSYPVPAFPVLSPLLHDLSNALFWRCQYCGKQNPIAKLGELSQRQSDMLLASDGTSLPEGLKEPPKRDMPESASKEAVVQATEKALSPTPKVPKPILKTPKFGLPEPEPNSSTISPPPTSIDPIANA